MGRRPNAGGGKYNQEKKNIATRARFSTWKPPTKTTKEKFLSQRSNQHTSRKESEEKISMKIPSNSMREREKGYERESQQGNDPLPQESLFLPEFLIEEFFTIFGESMIESQLSVVNPIIKNKETSQKIDVKIEKILEPLPFSLVKPSKFSALTEEEKRAQKQHDFFLNLGFTTEEIFEVVSLFQQPMTDDQLFVSLLQFIIDPSTLLLNQDLQPNPSSCFNADLSSELEILESIYGIAADSSSSAIFPPAQSVGIKCTPINLFDSIPTTRIELTTLDSEGVYVIRIMMYIIFSNQYPDAIAKLYGWLMPVGDLNSSALLFRSFSPHICREMSYSEIQNIQQRQNESQAPVLFDFIQNVLSAVVEFGNSKPLTVQAPPSIPSASTTSKKQSQRERKQQSKQTVVDLEPVSMTPEPAETENSSNVPPPLVKPSTKHMESPEYREAYVQALNLRLKGTAARLHARESLEYILPTSALEALKIEEKYAEDLIERTCSIENISQRNIIEGARILSERININKSHAKELFVAGKDSLYQAGDWFARDEATMREKCISEAITLFQQRLERKEQIRKEKNEIRLQNQAPQGALEDSNASRRRKHRGPTIRDAYDACGRRLGDPTLQDYESSPGGEPEDEEEEEFIEDHLVEQGLTQEDIEKRLLESRRMKNLHSERKKTQRYQQILNKREALPAYKMKAQIIQTIAVNNIIVISGDTGCGKTTQIPKMILDEYIENNLGAECNIIVTQPRRISAISVAEHISRERMESIGQSTGYQIRLESKKGPSTRLLLMTTGVLLRRLQEDLGDVSHLFIDEVHERDINTDFLLVIVKQLISSRPELKVILMSATLNANLFVDYFQRSLREWGCGTCALLTIPGRAFPVETYFLEDALEHTGHEVLADSEYAYRTTREFGGKTNRSNLPDDLRQHRISHIEILKRSRKYSSKTIQSLERVNESVINLKLIAKLVVYLLSQPTPQLDPTYGPGAILIFVPGLSDIRDVIEGLKQTPELSGRNKSRWTTRILPLHSSLSSYEQNLVFQIYPANIRKIIVSTNIAETSVTIEDVVYVIDTCRVKENRYDEASQLNVLDEQWISQANARQRRGRAGRVRSGICYHLACRFTVDDFPDFSVPEMLRMSLEELILQVLALELGDPYQFLGEALSPPENRSITNAILYLESLNALYVENIDTSSMDVISSLTDDVQIPSQITPLGYHLAALPISPRLGKLLLYSVLLQCVDPILTIASIISTKSPFVVAFNDRLAADEARLLFQESQSDLLTVLNAYDAWYFRYGEYSPTRERFDTFQEAKRSEEVWCQNNYLSLNSLKLIEQMRGQFLSLLQSIGFISEEISLSTISSSPLYNHYGRNIAILKCALCCSLSPNILSLPPQCYVATSISTGLTTNSEIRLPKTLMDCQLLCKRKGVLYQIHPSSIMSKKNQLDSHLFLYVDGMKTSKIYAHDITTIPLLSLLLFSGRLSASQRYYVLIVDGWLKYRSNKQTIRTFLKLRDLMEDTFLSKVMDPSTPLSEMWKQVMAVFARIIAP